MRIYVAGKWEERENVRRIQDALIAKGHSITVDWTFHEYSDAGYPEQYALDDIAGVQCADAYVGLFVNPNSYKGALVELGVALSSCQRVYIIGHAVDGCIFIQHPLIEQFDTESDFLEEIPDA